MPRGAPDPLRAVAQHPVACLSDSLDDLEFPVDSLKDKSALVTGAGSGIGRAVALALAREGCRVVLAGRREECLARVAEEVRGHGGNAFPVACDVGSRAAVDAMGAAAGRAGVVQILVNGAGIAPAASFLEMDDALLEEVMRTNFMGTYYCCKRFLGPMIEAGWGRIINIASTTARTAYPRTAAYTASKHAVLGLTRVMALETARKGVTVNAICPGYVDTELTRENARRMAAAVGSTVPEVLERFARTSPLGRLMTVDEVADLAVLLAGPAGDAVTGQAINVDGGAVMA